MASITENLNSEVFLASSWQLRPTLHCLEYSRVVMVSIMVTIPIGENFVLTFNVKVHESKFERPSVYQ